MGFWILTESCCDIGAECLRSEVGQDLSEWELLVDGHRDGDGEVEVRTGYIHRNPDSEQYADSGSQKHLVGTVVQYLQPVALVGVGAQSSIDSQEHE